MSVILDDFFDVLAIILGLAFAVCIYSACATTTGGKLRQGLSGGLQAAAIVEKIADELCKPVLARCIAAKRNPCPELIKCGQTKKALLMGTHGFVAGIREANELARGMR